VSKNTSENETSSICSDTPRWNCSGQQPWLSSLRCLVKRAFPSCTLLEEAELALETLIEGTMVYASGITRTVDQEALKAL
jgi:hypothetical protein